MKITRDVTRIFEEQLVENGIADATAFFKNSVADDVWLSQKRLPLKGIEREIKQHGTKIALQNLQWLIAADLMKDSGVKNIKTTYKR